MSAFARGSIDSMVGPTGSESGLNGAVSGSIADLVRTRSANRCRSSGKHNTKTGAHCMNMYILYCLGECRYMWSDTVLLAARSTSATAVEL